MIIIIVNEGLKVADLDLLLAAFALNQRVQLEEHPVTIVKRWGSSGGRATEGVSEALRVEITRMALKKFLNDLVTLKFVIGYAKDLKGLLTCDKAALNPQTFLCYLLSALVAEFLHRWLIVLFMEILEDLLHPFLLWQGSNEVNGGLFNIFWGKGSGVASPLVGRCIHLGCMFAMRKYDIIPGGVASPTRRVLTAYLLWTRRYTGNWRGAARDQVRWLSAHPSKLGMTEKRHAFFCLCDITRSAVSRQLLQVVSDEFITDYNFSTGTWGERGNLSMIHSEAPWILGDCQIIESLSQKCGRRAWLVVGHVIHLSQSLVLSVDGCTSLLGLGNAEITKASPSPLLLLDIGGRFLRWAKWLNTLQVGGHCLYLVTTTTHYQRDPVVKVCTWV